jgi:hypothetical protein
MLARVSLAALTLLIAMSPADAKRYRHYWHYQNDWQQHHQQQQRWHGDRGWYQPRLRITVRKHYRKKPTRVVRRHYPTGTGAQNVRSASGVRISVNPSAQVALQCVVDYVEQAGIKITAMRGYGRGTVRGSLHPSGRAIDINQTARDATRPRVPRDVANNAADKCGVVSGARWSYPDNGHWNLKSRYAREPWPRTLHASAAPAED